MSKFEVSILFKTIWVRASVISYKSSMRWLYSGNCDEMSKYEVSFWSKMVWVRASVISDKSSMRWLL